MPLSCPFLHLSHCLPCSLHHQHLFYALSMLSTSLMPSPHLFHPQHLLYAPTMVLVQASDPTYKTLVMCSRLSAWQTLWQQWLSTPTSQLFVHHSNNSQMKWTCFVNLEMFLPLYSLCCLCSLSPDLSWSISCSSFSTCDLSTSLPPSPMFSVLHSLLASHSLVSHTILSSLGPFL
jgi:hypothetical protein